MPAAVGACALRSPPRWWAATADGRAAAPSAWDAVALATECARSGGWWSSAAPAPACAACACECACRTAAGGGWSGAFAYADRGASERGSAAFDQLHAVPVRVRHRTEAGYAETSYPATESEAGTTSANITVSMNWRKRTTLSPSISQT